MHADTQAHRTASHRIIIAALKRMEMDGSALQQQPDTSFEIEKGGLITDDP